MNASVNRLYYSSFYLVSALLFQNKLNAQTHNGVKTNFFLHFVKTDKVSKDLGKLYSSLFDWRQESDSADFIDFDSDTVSPLVGQGPGIKRSSKTITSGIAFRTFLGDLQIETAFRKFSLWPLRSIS
ncbi:MAG: HEPN domain-containing protein [Saprospiraceae bacterium]|nr:HEPN domain-containing protein [Candidatus Opimibacter skivensis]